MGITTNDIARNCNVSRTTVIRALNNQRGISEETRQKILKVAKELGYRPDLRARSLVKGKSSYIGVVVYDVINQYFAQMVNAIEGEAQKMDYFVNISLHGKCLKKEKDLIYRLMDYHVDGLILSPVNQGEEFADFLRGLDIPMVVIGNRIADDIPYVGINEEMAAYEAIEKIAEKGYERICFVCPPLSEREMANIYAHEMRLAGVERALGNHLEIEKQIMDGLVYLDEVERMLQKDRKRTAFFCSGDVFALAIIKHLRGKGIHTPVDYGIMGFDNINFLEYFSPRLSTISNSIELVSETAVDLLFKLMNDEPASRTKFVNHKMIEGETL